MYVKLYSDINRQFPGQAKQESLWPFTKPLTLSHENPWWSWFWKSFTRFIHKTLDNLPPNKEEDTKIQYCGVTARCLLVHLFTTIIRLKCYRIQIIRFAVTKIQIMKWIIKYYFKKFHVSSTGPKKDGRETKGITFG